MMSHKFYTTLFCIIFVNVLRVQTIAAADFLCYQCNSTDSKCISDLTGFDTNCTVNEGEAIAGCFIKLDPQSNTIARGCLLSTATCAASNNCIPCTDQKCNNNNICIKCDSSTDSDCMQPPAASKSTWIDICPAANTQCLTVINSAKHTERRCATDDDVKNCNGDTCKLDNGTNSNIAVVPTNRRRCYQCSMTDTNCKDVIQGSLASKPCLLYDANDMCYTYGQSATQMARGCMSDTNKACNGGDCFACSIDNCNNKLYESVPTLKCINCVSTPENDKCMWGQDMQTAISCKNPIKYYETAMCYSQTSNNMVNRGCLKDRDASLGDCTEANNCTTCTTDGCNSKDLNDFTCIRCRSDQDPKCRNNAEDIKGISCRNNVMESVNKCYTGIWNDIVIRSCLVDADAATYITCNTPDNSNKCVICTGKDCNNKKSNANSLSYFLSVPLFTFMAIVKFFH